MRPMLPVLALAVLFGLACATGEAPPAPPAVLDPAAPPTPVDPAAVTATPATPAKPRVTPPGTPAPVEPAPAQPAPPGTKEYAATPDGICERLQDCGCNPMASVVACSKQTTYEMGRADATIQQMSAAQPPGSPPMRVDFSQMLYMAANSHCDRVCADHSKGVSFPVPAAPVPAAPINPATPTPVEPTPAVAAPVVTTLIIRATDGNWADLKLDGAPHSIRNSAELKIKLSPGAHTLAVAEFMSDTPHAKARVEGGVVPEVIVGIAAGKPVECFTATSCTPM